ncbi:MAG: N-acetylmuramoyl-L-alanine amidase [candidate division Zixibacteria bacterium]|nr:N-acetylmuramoyl-L-alanine amidase [candidate division Zixibacteria bacterium]
MKRIWLISVVAPIILMSMSERSLAPPYSVVCVDPGHGGPGASKYGPNGDGHGTCGPVLQLSEQWVNLQVGLELYDLIYYMGGVGFPVIMTRETEQAENLHWEFGYWYTMWERVNIANYGDDGTGFLVTQFISVHHNDYTPTPGSQGTEEWWSSQTYTDSSYLRDRGYWRPAYQDSLLAMKTQLRLLDLWNYRDRCITRCQPGSGSSFCCDETRFGRLFVLFNTVMPSVLSEASNLKDTTEELLFDDPYSGHADSEAVALYDGWYSHADNAGIAIVRNSYASGNKGKVIITPDWGCDDGDTVSSPFISCWLFGEFHCLKAMTPQIISGYEYTFHHWTHLNPMGGQLGDNWYEPEWRIMVQAEYDYHRYVAYFTGGPYSAQVDTPNGGQNWCVGEQRTIAWTVSPGADSTTYVDVFLDRNGGNDGYPERIVDSIPGAYYWGWTWTVTPPYSTHCRIKVVAYDRAGNSAEDVSNYDFIISESGNNNPVIDSYLHCKYPYDECADCIKYGEAVTIEILAHDPDGDSIFYEWYCFFGHFAENGQNTITTAENFVTYVAPTKGKAESPALRSEPSGSKTNGGEGEETLFDDFISVGVIDVRGGDSVTVGWPELHDQEYTCLCGDANDDLIVNLGDIVYLVGYVFRGGSPPYDPFERGDANNDCEIDLGDIVYLTSYVFQGGPPPECCWFPPEQ